MEEEGKVKENKKGSRLRKLAVGVGITLAVIGGLTLLKVGEQYTSKQKEPVRLEQEIQFDDRFNIGTLDKPQYVNLMVTKDTKDNCVMSYSVGDEQVIIDYQCGKPRQPTYFEWEKERK